MTASTLVDLRAEIVRLAKIALEKYEEEGFPWRTTNTSRALLAVIGATRRLRRLEKRKEREISAGKKAAKTRRRNEAQWKQQQRRR